MVAVIDVFGLLLILLVVGSPLYPYLLLRRWRAHWAIRLLVGVVLAILFFVLLSWAGLAILLRNGIGDFRFG